MSRKLPDFQGLWRSQAPNGHGAEVQQGIADGHRLRLWRHRHDGTCQSSVQLASFSPDMSNMFLFMTLYFSIALSKSHIYIYLYLLIYINLFICLFVYLSIYWCMYVFVFTIYLSIFTYLSSYRITYVLFIHLFVYICKYIYMQIYIYICVCTCTKIEREKLNDVHAYDMYMYQIYKRCTT